MDPDLREELINHLTGPLPSIPSKYLYDDVGSALFEAITGVPEYYQARTEIAILDRVAEAIADHVQPYEIVELGAGAGRKIHTMLDACTTTRLLTLLDVNAVFLDDAARKVREAHKTVGVRSVVGDFTRDLDRLGPPPSVRLVVFFAGTVGNLHPSTRPDFFTRVSQMLDPGGALLLGVDLVKGADVLDRAYDDDAGVTAAFNRNALNHLNAVADANFDLAGFDHRAFFDTRKQWIEMRLVANRPMTVTATALDLTLNYDVGDEIRTEISCKFTRELLAAEVQGTGLSITRWDTDELGRFALCLLSRE